MVGGKVSHSLTLDTENECNQFRIWPNTHKCRKLGTDLSCVVWQEIWFEVSFTTSSFGENFPGCLRFVLTALEGSAGFVFWLCKMLQDTFGLSTLYYESWLTDDKSSEFRRMHKAQCLHCLAFFPPYNFSIQIQRKFKLSSDWLDNIRYALTEAIYKCLRSTACLSCPTFLRLSFFSHQSLSIFTISYFPVPDPLFLTPLLSCVLYVFLYNLTDQWSIGQLDYNWP